MIRILFITQYFPPEVEAGGLRIYDFGKILASKGHKVYVLTGMPNFPTGVKPKEYKYKIFIKEYKEDIHVFRSYSYATENKGLVKRLISYFSFVVSSILSSVFIPKIDIIVATSPPLFTGISGLVISKFLRKTPFIFEVRDLWPESAVALGLIKNSLVIRILKKMEEFFYKYADHIVAVTSRMADSIIMRKIDKNKISYIPNGVNLELFKPKEKINRIRKELKIEDKFVVLYSGTHGVSQGLYILLKAADILRTEKDIIFILIGDGADKQSLKNQAVKYKLDNVLFLNPVPRTEIVEYISASDVCLVLLIKLNLFLGAVPSKLYEYMALEKPIILGVDGEARNILESAQAVIFIEPENHNELVQAILKMKRDPMLIARFGKNGRIKVEKDFSRNELADKYEHIFSKLTSS